MTTWDGQASDFDHLVVTDRFAPRGLTSARHLRRRADAVTARESFLLARELPHAIDELEPPLLSPSTPRRRSNDRGTGTRSRIGHPRVFAEPVAKERVEHGRHVVVTEAHVRADEERSPGSTNATPGSSDDEVTACAAMIFSASVIGRRVLAGLIIDTSLGEARSVVPEQAPDRAMAALNGSSARQSSSRSSGAPASRRSSRPKSVLVRIRGSARSAGRSSRGSGRRSGRTPETRCAYGRSRARTPALHWPPTST